MVGADIVPHWRGFKLVVRKQLDGKIHLPCRPELVGVWGYIGDKSCDLPGYSELAGYKSSINKSGQESKKRVIKIKMYRLRTSTVSFTNTFVFRVVT